MRYFMSWIKDVAELLRKRANINATVRELHLLSDNELKDIGIHRSQIEEVARGIIDFHRAVRDKTEEPEGLDGFKDIQGSREDK